MTKQDIILNLLRKNYPDSKTALNFTTPMEILVSTILSAQCTDKRVNIVTKELFKKYKSPKEYAQAKQEELEKYIRSTGFYHNKAKNIIATANKIMNDYDGTVPDTMQELLTLPGVARKTANIVMWNAYKKISGVAVDTHCGRVSYRLGLTKNTAPVKVEKDLMTLYQEKEWPHVTNFMISHGRAVCKAPNPICSECFLFKICPKNGVKKQL